ncbi:RES family NAD+ phosphorylase [Oceanimonas smirnovii]|uniref:RES family NAD+ phosphorylase n=1 Tax=Oceanimonas smirnovii TaxID=264574 RepID=A0ABW7NZ81_9GAMM
MSEKLEQIQLQGQGCYRLIPSKYPPIALYEDVATLDELEAVYAVEAMTNPRLLDEAGDLSLVPRKDRLVNIPHCSYAMAAFTHINSEGARFTTGDFGGYYCAPSLDTAIKETIYHQERLCGYTKEPAQRIQMRSLFARFNAALIDITAEQHLSSNLYHPTDYNHSQAFASEQRSYGVDGLKYRSVRHAGHDCFVLFKPRLITEICQAKHFDYCWNGNAITNVLEINIYK